MAYVLIRAIHYFARILILLLCGRAILSWFARDPYSPLGKLYMISIQLTEPIVAPCRRFLSRWNTGVIDFSVLLAFFLVEICENILVRIIVNFAMM